ncbi:MAG: UDP-N-acetylmuramoyl-tripeptide--D-alanyl-D-alanine ligase [Elusimicrobiota bacterium]
METITIAEILSAIKGRFLAGNENEVVGGISVDTRTLREGDLFFALAGQNDGHRFVKEALRKKALGVVISKNVAMHSAKGSIVLVDDTLQALQDLAKYYLEKMGLPVIGITGSNGKTTTKELLKAVLSQGKNVYANPGNFNNHIGLPLSIFGIKKADDYCVLEMGANHQGEIKNLAQICHPKIGVITNIGDAHLGCFGSREAILRTKMELLQSLPADGFAVINGDDVFLKRARKDIPCPYFTFGKYADVDLRAHSIRDGEEGTNFIVSFGNNDYPVRASLPGEFNVENILAAVCVGWRLNIEIKKIIWAINNFRIPVQRMNLISLPNDVKVVDDSYNANPKAMRSAIAGFIRIFPQREKFLVLGDMLELGEFSDEEHQALGGFAASLPVAGIFFYGKEMSSAAKAAEKKTGCPVFWTENKIELLGKLKEFLHPGSAFFIKASHDMHLEEVVEEMTKTVEHRS